MTNQEPLRLEGCRHDVLGHYLKAIGLLRVLAKCADLDHRDQEAEGWWDVERACFFLRSPKYKTFEDITEFFESRYRPTPVFSAWNTGGGMNEKKEVVFSVDPKFWNDYWLTHKEALKDHGFKAPSDESVPEFPNEPFNLKCADCTLPSTDQITIRLLPGKGETPRPEVAITWSPKACSDLFTQLKTNEAKLRGGIKFTKPVVKVFVDGKPKPEFVFDVASEKMLSEIDHMTGVTMRLRKKETGKKAVMSLLRKRLPSGSEAIQAIDLGANFFDQFQEDGADDRTLLEAYREQCPGAAAEAFDAIFTTRTSSRPEDNPLFLNRGDAGAAEVFRSFWVFFCDLQGDARVNVYACLKGSDEQPTKAPKGKGAPFFPDAVKLYNMGSGWVEEEPPFYPLDYILAVEGAFAIRGSAARAIGSRSKRFAAFPFLFDSGEDMVDDGNDVKGTASSLWFPLWKQGTTYAELSEFIGDAQARLPQKEARFSSEFVRALYAQGVDAGFSGWQEFRFKMKGSRVPWITTGRYLEAPPARNATKQNSTQPAATLLNRGLAPLDASLFMDQFGISFKGSKVDPRSPHRVRTAINEAIETAMSEPTPQNCIEVIESIFKACRQICVSESFRKKLTGQRFFAPLPMREWDELLSPLEDRAEFRIARAISSMQGLMPQAYGNYSAVQPMLGSMLPLTLGRKGWYLPEKKEQTHQDVWTGIGLTADLAVVLGRRYRDSLNDDRPAIRSPHGADLRDILAFLDCSLDDVLIARWAEAMSLIGWQFESKAETSAKSEKEALDEEDERSVDFVDTSYAALKTLLEVECEWQGSDRSRWKKRRSQQPIALLCTRSAPSLSLAVSEALRWISIWGVPNPWGPIPRAENPRLEGKYVIRTDWNQGSTAADPQTTERLAAAVCIPLRYQDRWKLFRAVTLPPGQ